MTFFSILNITVSLLACLIVIVTLFRFGDKHILWERVGMGLIGAAMVLNTAPIMQTGSPFSHRIPTPFDDWGSTLLRVGIASYFAGRLIRDLRHSHLNRRAAKRAWDTLSPERREEFARRKATWR